MAILTCANSTISLKELMNSARVRVDGQEGIMTIQIAADAEDIEVVMACAGEPALSIEELLRRCFALTDSGKTALVLFTENP